MGARRRLRSKQPPPEDFQNPNHSDAGHVAGTRPQAEAHFWLMGLTAKAHVELILSSSVRCLLGSLGCRCDGQRSFWVRFGLVGSVA